jgi:hypothetical protein
VFAVPSAFWMQGRTQASSVTPIDPGITTRQYSTFLLDSRGPISVAMAFLKCCDLFKYSCLLMLTAFACNRQNEEGMMAHQMLAHFAHEMLAAVLVDI